MIWVACALGFAFFVFASGFFSGSETGLYCVNRLRLRLRNHRGDPGAARLQALLGDEQSALSVILVGTNVANYLTTVFMAMLLASKTGLSDRGVELYTTLIVTPVVFVFGEMVPKNLFQRDADRLLYYCSWGLSQARWLFSPVVWCIRALSDRLVSLVGATDAQPAVTDHRRRMAWLLHEALVDADHTGRQREFVDRALLLPDTPVRSVMIRLGQVVTIAADADRAEFLRVVRNTGHSRLPVVGNTSKTATGIVGVIDVHCLLADDTWQVVAERIEQPERLDPSESVAAAIMRVQRSPLPMAVVRRADGADLGIVTLKDLLEELVGDLDAW